MQTCEFLSKDYRTFDASELPDGTVVNMSVWAFFKLDNPDMRGVEHWQVPYECAYSEGLHGFYPGGGCV